MWQPYNRRVTVVHARWVLREGLSGGWWACALGLTLLIASCGDDGEAKEPTGEPCFQAGQYDANCLCDADRPRGVRQCMQNLIWTECVCGEPFPEPCVEGEPVECPPCNGRPRTTTCLRAGTFDCGECGDEGGSGSGRQDAGR
jgi:hypothetical protein